MGLQIVKKNYSHFIVDPNTPDQHDISKVGSLAWALNSSDIKCVELVAGTYDISAATVISPFDNTLITGKGESSIIYSKRISDRKVLTIEGAFTTIENVKFSENQAVYTYYNEPFIYINGAQSTSITECTFALTSSRSCVDIYNSWNVDISNNSFIGWHVQMVHVGNSTYHNRVTNNIFENFGSVGATSGMGVTTLGGYVTITNNFYRYSSPGYATAFVLSTGGYNILANNIIDFYGAASAAYGCIYVPGSRHIVAKNIVKNVGTTNGACIYVSGQRNLITENVLTGGSYGVWKSASTLNGSVLYNVIKGYGVDYMHNENASEDRYW